MDNNVTPPLYFTTTDRKQLMERLQAIETDYGPHLLNLTAEERQKKRKMRDKSTAFVSKTIEYARELTEAIPPIIDIDEMEAAFNQAQELDIVIRKTEMLLAGLSDARIASADLAFTTALKVYNILRSSNDLDLPGINTALDELGKRFSGRPPKRNTANDPFPEVENNIKTQRDNRPVADIDLNEN